MFALKKVSVRVEKGFINLGSPFFACFDMRELGRFFTDRFVPIYSVLDL